MAKRRRNPEEPTLKHLLGITVGPDTAAATREVMRMQRTQVIEPTLERLLRITDGCRRDMHEPDEQGLEARVVGFKLDNAFGDDISDQRIVRGWQEYVVVLERVTDDASIIEQFNLADLIALARLARHQP